MADSNFQKLVAYTAASAIATGIIYTVYKNYSIEPTNVLKLQQSNDELNREIKTLKSDLMTSLRTNNEVIIKLRNEIANLRNQVTFVKNNNNNIRTNNLDLVGGGNFDDQDSIISRSEKSFKTTKSILSYQSKKHRSSASKSSSNAKNSSNKLRPSVSFDDTQNQTQVIHHRDDVKSFASDGDTFPDSDDDIWQDPDLGLSDFDFDNDSLIEKTEQEIFDFSKYSEKVRETFPHINLNISVYNPKPWSGLSSSIYQVCLQVDELHYKGDDPVLESYNSMIHLISDNPSASKCVDLYWRICRSLVYLSALFKLKGQKAKKEEFLMAGLKFGQTGVSKLEAQIEEEITLEYDEEFKVTTICPMYKWAAACIGMSAEIVEIGDKVKNGFISRDYYQKAMEIDPLDYYVYLGLGRWHYEISQLPYAIKWAANRIAKEPMNSSVDDCLQILRKIPTNSCIKIQEAPFINMSCDIYLLWAKCLHMTGKDQQTAKEYIKKAKEISDEWTGYQNGMGSELDTESKKEVEEFYRKIVG